MSNVFEVFIKKLPTFSAFSLNILCEFSHNIECTSINFLVYNYSIKWTGSKIAILKYVDEHRLYFLSFIV